MKLNIGIVLNQTRIEKNVLDTYQKFVLGWTKTNFRDFLSLVNLLRLSSFVLFCEKNMV